MPDLDLRDYFAAKVLAAWIVASPKLDGENKEHQELLARISYEQAYAMLRAREVTP